MNETTKSYEYRKKLGYDKFFKGHGIDLGAGDWPLTSRISPDIESVLPYDYMGGYEDIMKPNLKNKTLQGKFGNAETCYNLEDSTFDFVYSSHMLEHLEDPYTAFRHWIRICKPGGFIFVSVPHEIFYEKCVWPSKFADQNNLGFLNHYTSWTLEWQSNLPASIHIPEFINTFVESGEVTYILAKTEIHHFDFTKFYKDQTIKNAICQIDFIVQKTN